MEGSKVKEFYIRYLANTLSSLSGRIEHQKIPLPKLEFLYPAMNITIYLFDYLEEHNNLKNHIGLGFIVHIREIDEDQAIKKSKNLVENILNIISFESLSPCKSAKLISIVDSTNKNSCPTKFLISPFEEKFSPLSPIQIDKKRFDMIWNSFINSESKRRLMRSLSWLRKGIDSRIVVDEFISYFIALNVLEPLLRENRKWDGLDNIFDQNEVNSPYEFTEIRRARNRLFHGATECDELSDSFINELNNYLEPMRRAIIYGILVLLNIQKDYMFKNFINKKPLRVRGETYFIQKGIIENLLLSSSIIPEKFPELKVTNKQKIISLKCNGDLDFKLKYTTKYKLPNGSNFMLKEVESWID